MDVTQKIKSRLSLLSKQIKEQPRLYAHLADCYLLQGKYKQAGKLLSQGLERFPNHALGWLVKGNLHLRLNQRKLAHIAFKQALKINNDIAFAHERCVEMTEAEGDMDRYIFHLRELRRLDPIDDSVQGRLDTALLRKTAVENGLYTEDRVVHISSKMLRRTLLEHNLIPQEIERKKERFFKAEGGLLQPTTISQDEMLSKATEYASEFVPGAADDAGGEMVSAWDTEGLSGLGAGDQEQTGQTTETGTEEELESRESPLMKLLRGEMEERPSPKEVNFVRDAEGSGQKRSTSGLDIDSNVKPGAKSRPGTKEMNDEELKRHEETQASLAKIAREVTGAAIKTAAAETKSTTSRAEVKPVAETSAEEFSTVKEAGLETEKMTGTAAELGTVETGIAEPGDKPTGKQAETDIQLTPAWENELVDKAVQTDEEAVREEVPPVPTEVKPSAGVEKVEQPKDEKSSKGRVPTKTLAELYASQGDFKNAVAVYDELLAKHPTNKVYRKRLDELKLNL